MPRTPVKASNQSILGLIAQRLAFHMTVPIRYVNKCVFG
jgi:hypothetical protein